MVEATTATQPWLTIIAPVATISMVFIACAGLIYWAIHNMGKDLRQEMQEGNRLLREGMREGDRLLREEMREGDRLLREEMREGDRLLREEMREGDHLLRQDMSDGFTRLERQLARHKHDDAGSPYVPLDSDPSDD